MFVIVLGETKEDTSFVSLVLISVEEALASGIGVLKVLVDWSLTSVLTGTKELPVCKLDGELIWDSKLDLELTVLVCCPDASEGAIVWDEDPIAVMRLLEDCVVVPFDVFSNKEDNSPLVDSEERVSEEAFSVVTKPDRE